MNFSFKVPFLFHPPLSRSHQPHRTFPLWQVLDAQFDLLPIFEERYLGNYWSWVLSCFFFTHLNWVRILWISSRCIFEILISCQFEEPYLELLLCLLGIPAHCWLDLHVVYAIGYVQKDHGFDPPMDVDLISCWYLIFYGSVFACTTHTYLKMLDIFLVFAFETNRKCLVSISVWYLYVPNIPGTPEHN